MRLNPSWDLSLTPVKFFFQKMFYKGGSGGVKKIFFFRKNFFFKSCSESSETNFGILKVTFEIFPPGAKLGSNFDRKGSIFSKFQILTINFPRIKFEAVWDNGLPPTSISSVPIQIPDILLAHPHDATCRL